MSHLMSHPMSHRLASLEHDVIWWNLQDTGLYLFARSVRLEGALLVCNCECSQDELVVTYMTQQWYQQHMEGTMNRVRA